MSSRIDNLSSWAMSFIWQGKKSTDYGIFMTAKPNVTFPETRYSEQYINGSNSSIITKEGYGCFDLKLSIALDGNFVKSGAILNKNGYELLSDFFYDNPEYEGYDAHKLVIGNRPTVAYDAQILSSIDFEELLNFHTADVVFHCQPFKTPYDSAENVYRKWQISGDVAVGSSAEVSVTYSGVTVPRQPKLFVQPNFTISTSTFVDIVFETSFCNCEYYGKHWKTGMLKNFLQGCAPIFYFDLATDECLVFDTPNGIDIGNEDMTPLIAEGYILDYFTADKAILQLTPHLITNNDISTGGEVSASFWRDVAWDGTRDTLTVKRYEGGTESSEGTFSAWLLPEVKIL